MITDLEPA